MADRAQELRRLPAVDQLLRAPGLEPVTASMSHEVVVALAREELAATRRLFLAGEIEADALASDAVAERVAARAAALRPAPLRRVINATGILLHTNLGRAPLSAGAQAAVAAIYGGYSALEMDLGTGKRTSRLGRVRRLLRQVCGADDALAVNNNAAAVFLTLHVLVGDREVIISRGEQVEIGGSFRLPDIIEASGAVMRDVGTTNRTRLSDYRKALSARTAMILKVHPSNYVIDGFTESVTTAELAGLAREADVPLVEDLGSGALRQHPSDFLRGEPRVQDTLEAGAALVSFSGDKLLGGPQAGILAGEAPLIERLCSHPLARIVRLDKLHLAALEATLIEYTRGEEGLEAVPLYRLLNRPIESLREQAEELAVRLREVLGGSWRVEVIETEAVVGGGSLPGETVPSCGVALMPVGLSLDVAARWLRAGEPPIVPRLYQERMVIDMRSLLEDDARNLLEHLPARLRSLAEHLPAESRSLAEHLPAESRSLPSEDDCADA